MTMASEQPAADAALFRAMRRTWERVDPHPADLIDRMVAAVAADDLSTEYALLTLVESDAAAAVRGDADLLTLQFSDGTTTVLIHVTVTDRGGRRIDGWVDGDASSAALEQDSRELSTPVEGGRFSFDEVAAGPARLRIAPGSDGVELRTPGFEL